MRILTVLAALAAALPSCSKDGGAFVAPETICTSGATKCFGNYSATCTDDGKAWDLVFCGAAQYCDDGQCRSRGCTPAGRNSCVDDGTQSRCPENGVASVQVKCAAGTSCQGGECLASPCDAGTVKCVYATRYTCTGGGWTVEACPKDQACDGDACVPTVCEPEAAQCSGEDYSGVCNANGTGRVVTACAKPKEHCLDGFCQPVVANPPVPDDAFEAAGWDLPPVEGLEDGVEPEPREDLPVSDLFTPGLNKATINGTTITFSLSHDANWVVNDKMLMINLISKKLEIEGIGTFSHNLEIRLAGIEEGQVGTFKCEDAASYGVQFWYRYGKYQQGEKCKDFDYEGHVCTVVVTAWDADHVAGTFTDAELVDCQQDGTTVTVTDGQFDVSI
jgi:hypothetical protein